MLDYDYEPDFDDAEPLDIEHPDPEDEDHSPPGWLGEEEEGYKFGGDYE